MVSRYANYPIGAPPGHHRVPTVPINPITMAAIQQQNQQAAVVAQQQHQVAAAQQQQAQQQQQQQQSQQQGQPQQHTEYHHIVQGGPLAASQTPHPQYRIISKFSSSKTLKKTLKIKSYSIKSTNTHSQNICKIIINNINHKTLKFILIFNEVCKLFLIFFLICK